MDSSNKLNFILEGFTIPATEIKASEWLKIIKAALAICKPYLKYFPGFEPISVCLNCHLGEYDRRETNEAIVEFPKGITQETKCIEINNFIRETEGEIHGDGVRFVMLQTLFLSRNGKWINWDYKYERQVQHGLGYRSHRTGIIEVANICKFSLVNEDTLLRFLKEKHRSGQQSLGQLILNALHSLAIKGVREKKERLQRIEQAEEQLARIRSRIDELLW